MNALAMLTSATIAACLVLGAGTDALASDVVTGKDVKQAVLARLAQENMIAEPHVSERRHYYSCASELEVWPKFKGSWDTAKVVCPDEGKEWDILVRTGLVTVTPSETANDNQATGLDIVVLLASIKRGAIITEDIVALAPASAGSRLGSFYRIEDVVGRRAKQSISAMQTLKARHLEHQWAVQAGQPVQIVHRLNGFEVSSVGKILEDAQIGDIVLVTNTKSGREISALVESAKKVSPIANIN